MNKNEEIELAWKNLTGLNEEIRNWGNTRADFKGIKKHSAIPVRIIRYLARHVQGKIWLNHLALVVLYSVAQNYDEATIYTDITTLHNKFSLLFRSKLIKHKVRTMSEFKAEKYLTFYFKGFIGTDTPQTRLYFYNRYQSVCKRGKMWLATLPYNLQEVYQAYLFTPVNSLSLTHSMKTREAEQRQQKKRKEETDSLLPYYPDLRRHGHLRFNLISKLWQAFKEAIKSHPSLPCTFTYQDGETLYYLRLWDYQTFMKEYENELTTVFKKNLDKKQGILKENRYFLEVQKIFNTRTKSEEPLWFADILKYGLIRSRRFSKEASDWLDSWGYAKSSFTMSTGKILSWQKSWHVMKVAERVLPGTLLLIDDLYAVCAFGLLAVDLFTTTGARLSETMQISLDRDCLIRLVMPAPPSAKNQTPRIRYILRLVPKGEKKMQRQDFFIGEETKKLLVRVGQMLGEHYCLQVVESIPTVNFCSHSARAHKFKSAPYLFQYRGAPLNGVTISSCLRFILHGIFLKTRNGRQFAIRPHLLRHAFATHAVQVEKIPLDIVGKWLHQKNIAITEYYSRVTDSMAAEAADAFLAQVAASIDINQAILRSPKELQQLMEDAKGKTGTFAEVIGGICVSHGYCSVKFECIGCAGKVPEPSKHYQVERRKEWALKELAIAEKEGLYPEAQRLRKLIADAEAELREMKMIEEYQNDEARTGKINFTSN